MKKDNVYKIYAIFSIVTFITNLYPITSVIAQINVKDEKALYMRDDGREMNRDYAKEHPWSGIEGVKVRYFKDIPQIAEIFSPKGNVKIDGAISEDDAVQKFIRQYASELKIDPEMSNLMIKNRGVEKPPGGGVSTTVYNYMQSYKGYPLIETEGNIFLIRVNKDFGITSISNTINPFIQDRDLKLKITKEEAEQIGRDKICGKNLCFAEMGDTSLVKGPFVWVYKDIPKLIWEVVVVRKITEDDHVLLVNAENGEVERIRKNTVIIRN